MFNIVFFENMSKQEKDADMVAHPCNPSSLEAQAELLSSRPACAIYHKTLTKVS